MDDRRAERVGAHLNRALAALLTRRPDLYLIGADVADPYGGAFGVTRRLSTEHPDRVLTTPISEQAIVGFAVGLALRGREAVVEIMFSDFATLCFDQIANLAGKVVSMYGEQVRMPLVIRCPTGGNRGYGPTHSQSLQKHFLGIPNLALYEMSPVHDGYATLAQILDSAAPALYFEDKVLYGRRRFGAATGDEMFHRELIGGSCDFAVLGIRDVDPVDVVVIAPGGLTDRVLGAMRDAYLGDETAVRAVVPSRLYPFDPAPLAPLVGRARRVVVVEDAVAGGVWGAEVAHAIHQRMWHLLSGPVRLLHAPSGTIPAAAHLERAVLVQADDIRATVTAVARG
ncbi:transketolase C-terminal domain-containing protein [Micromonospora sediminimaris]|uniref:Pyruvate dehydrogenase n=1 Tax=Micromonospora sediminimaris TaxID=547162 RepID=A0A9W5UPM3_9ACTN|nr:transketolase C-terminal domain-containing protein [Micromonospora sediminimaris]GIJ32862.1 pyruvate dehydrogenase [Micromonospora sediminimaris]SFD05128.1 pyruvate dehydrogenase E1 component beta subunit [Micromonospora sediminimaris]